MQCCSKWSRITDFSHFTVRTQKASLIYIENLFHCGQLHMSVFCTVAENTRNIDRNLQDKVLLMNCYWTSWKSMLFRHLLSIIACRHYSLFFLTLRVYVILLFFFTSRIYLLGILTHIMHNSFKHFYFSICFMWKMWYYFYGCPVFSFISS